MSDGVGLSTLRIDHRQLAKDIASELAALEDSRLARKVVESVPFDLAVEDDPIRSVQALHLELARVQLELRDAKAAAAMAELAKGGTETAFKVGDKVRITDNGSHGIEHYWGIGSVARVAELPELGSSSLYVTLPGRAVGQYVSPEDMELVEPRVFSAGDPEPADKETIVLVGFNDDGWGRLQYGQLSSVTHQFNPEGWWKTDGTNHDNWNVRGSWEYWLGKFGPLTEVL